MLSYDWASSKPNLVLAGEQLEKVDKLSYLFVSHMVIAYRMKCLRPLKRLDSNSII